MVQAASRRSPRVVHIINDLSAIGGAQRLVLDLARQSDQQPVPVIAWQSRENSLIEADSSGAIDLIALRPFSWKALQRARRAVASADVVHIHLFPTQYFGPFLSKPTIFTEHNTWNRRRQYPWLRPLERQCYRRFTKTIAISDDTGITLTEWLGEKPPRLETIPNGIDLSRFSRRSRTRSHDRFMVGMAARMNVEKDHATLLKAFSMLPGEFRLMLAGEGPLRDQLEQQSRTLGLDDRVRFIGTTRNMPQFFDDIDVYVQSSWYDGFSLTVVEAMASGLPTVGSDIGGLRVTIGTPDALFRPGDAQHLAQRLMALASDSAALCALSAHAVQQASRFDIRHTAECYARAYAEVANAR